MVICWGTRGHDVNVYILGAYSSPHNRSLTSPSAGEWVGIWKWPCRPGCWRGTAQGERTWWVRSVAGSLPFLGQQGRKAGCAAGEVRRMEPQSSSACPFEHLPQTLNSRASWLLRHFHVCISGHFTFGNFNADRVRKGILEDVVLNITQLPKE